ncbi:leucyl/phenylalanyl-tRNA--protein transferase [Blastochloris sulfoviridis]|uniref:Leucyl/phenylalanyl-tRNA--protein transferase n=1 Tax=Blastochloris sulfoviridis TaxID=50712 RepID=A0A5M6I1B6_9HYPH|nr:leucyl/phenylalanyl-tRNA--protein transferase [Blastochloris sulfoviridis]KAA5601966.1 leucyl/phenylalanyl-tRNA--protein transferase [Blastochloris sulfoviridis]
MTRGFSGQVDITPEVLLKAYACGIFPMAESADDPGLYWIEPERRGIIPLDGLHVSRRLARTIRSDLFEVRIDCDFEGVLDGCSMPASGRMRTWINARIRRLYRELFDLGHCHSVETYRDGLLVGGLYGVAIGGAFFGESMFHVETDASKVALVHLAALLLVGGFTLLDTQFSTRHLESFGCIEVSRNQYHRLLEQALAGRADFRAAARRPMPGAAALAIVQSANERRSDPG